MKFMSFAVTPGPGAGKKGRKSSGRTLRPVSSGRIGGGCAADPDETTVDSTPLVSRFPATIAAADGAAAGKFVAGEHTISGFVLSAGDGRAPEDGRPDASGGGIAS
jgi:hypothetical protein